MKLTSIIIIVLAASTSYAWEGTHPGLPPSAESSSTAEGSILSDVRSRTINTKYGTSMTADEIKEAAQNRRAQRDLDQERGGPGVITQPADHY